MMLQVFSYKGRLVRVLETDGEISFFAKDVCNALELTRDAVKDGNYTPSGEKIISESGVYELAIEKGAKDFLLWVTHEVLPSTRVVRVLELEVEKLELDIERAKMIERMLYNPPFPITPEIGRDFAHEVYRIISGHECLLMLPECPDKWYTAREIGAELGLSEREVGKIASEIKPPEGESNEYGCWVAVKSKYSPREMPCFIYSGDGLEWLREKLSEV